MILSDAISGEHGKTCSTTKYPFLRSIIYTCHFDNRYIPLNISARVAWYVLVIVNDFFHIKVLLFCILAKVSINSRT